MILKGATGSLSDPLDGRCWDPPAVQAEVHDREARFESLGLQRGDRVFLHHGNTLEFFVDLLAIWEFGGCAVPIDGRLTPFELGVLADAARPRFTVGAGDPVILRHAEEPPAGPSKGGPALDDDALILFTSGTTGKPKGVVHTHRSLRSQWEGLRRHVGLDAFRRTLCLLPTHFGHGLICNSLFPWLSGQDLFVGPAFRPDLVMRLGTLVDKHHITFMSSVPSLWRLALKSAKPPESRSLERVFCGSAPLSAALWDSVREWTGTSSVFNAYGITETGSWLAGTTIPDFTPEDGLIGEPWGGTIRVLRSKTTATRPDLLETCPPGDSGYVWVRTPALMRGYLDREDLTREVVRDGWFVTGDIGYLDDRGYLYLRGREREEINKGGMKIYPGDVDAVVERFPGTLDVCTFAFEEPLQGEDVGIAVVLRQADAATLHALYDFVILHLARHQVPQRWYLVDELPRTSRGKVNRATVALHCAALQPVDLRGIAR